MVQSQGYDSGIVKDKDGSMTVMPEEAHVATIVFLHGDGDTAENFLTCTYVTGMTLPKGFKVVVPQSPKHTHPHNGCPMYSW